MDFFQFVIELFHKPKWKKEALLLDKAAKRFVNYKRDLLDSHQIAEIESRRKDLQICIRRNEARGVEDAGRKLETACESSFPNMPRPGALSENVEVFFVAIAIALGIRAYILQPFRIPTGSMQPSLNGIIVKTMPKSEWPAAPVRWFQLASKGRSYFSKVADRDLELKSPDISQSIIEKTYLKNFTYTHLYFKDGSKISINAPLAELLPILGPKFALKKAVVDGRQTYVATRPFIRKGAVIASGYSQSGDLVLVDKVSYHFRKPQRGESFVFDTRGIAEIHRNSTRQGAGWHYIKRLAGVPGDTINVGGTTGTDNRLYIDGSVAMAPGFKRVMDAQGEYEGLGYKLAQPGPRYPLQAIGSTLTLKKERVDSIMREYAALGDNQNNSLDSRYWGPLREYNLVGPAFFSLWPFTSGHWGLIE